MYVNTLITYTSGSANPEFDIPFCCRESILTWKFNAFGTYIGLLWIIVPETLEYDERLASNGGLDKLQM